MEESLNDHLLEELPGKPQWEAVPKQTWESGGLYERNVSEFPFFISVCEKSRKQESFYLIRL
jgi:hypothetical protein